MTNNPNIPSSTSTSDNCHPQEILTWVARMAEQATAGKLSEAPLQLLTDVSLALKKVGCLPNNPTIDALLEATQADLALDQLGLTNRALNGLRRQGIRTIADLCARTESRISRVAGLGVVSIDEVKRLLNARGLSLAPEQLSSIG